MKYERASITRNLSFAILLSGYFCLMSTAVAHGVCDRTPLVQATILASIPEVEHCDDVTEEHLKTIRYLNLSNNDLANLLARDFTGLSRLVDINLEHNNLTDLPVAIFDSLESIEIIRLGNNLLSALPENTFSELSHLRLLKLNDNSLHTLSPDLFGTLPSLYELNISGNPITELSDVLLGRMPRLNSLELNVDSVEHISPTIFGRIGFLQLDRPLSDLTVQDALFGAQSGVSGNAAVFERRSSRLFAVRNQYPPQNFDAYAIIAFSSGETTGSEERYRAICEGFVATILASSELIKEGVPESAQFPTIWPMHSVSLANSLNSSPNVDRSLCSNIVTDIDRTMSAVAIDRAQQQGRDSNFDGDGPYLLAWAPGSDFGNAEDDVLILDFDLSSVQNSVQAERVFKFWIEEIERDPGTWERGFNLDRIRLKILLGADAYGGIVLDVFASIFGW